MVTLEVSSCEVRAITIKSSAMSEENPYSPPVNQVEAPPIQSAVPGLHNYASLGQRLLGKIIDVLIMIPLSLGIGVAYALISPPKFVAVEKLSDVFLGGASVYGLGETLLLAVIGIAAYIGIQWAFWASTGQSIGKKVMKTQVVNLDGSQASVQTIAFKRYGIINLIANVPTIRASSFILLACFSFSVRTAIAFMMISLKPESLNLSLLLNKR